MLPHILTLHKKWSFPLRISSVNVTRSGISFLCSVTLIAEGINYSFYDNAYCYWDYSTSLYGKFCYSGNFYLKVSNNFQIRFPNLYQENVIWVFSSWKLFKYLPSLEFQRSLKKDCFGNCKNKCIVFHSHVSLSLFFICYSRITEKKFVHLQKSFCNIQFW